MLLLSSEVRLSGKGDATMMRIVFAFHLVAFIFAPVVLIRAQGVQLAADSGNVTADQVNDANIQLMRRDIRAQRKQIVAANMPLTEDEATKFWPLYDRYIGETIKVNDVRYALIKEYAQN